MSIYPIIGRQPETEVILRILDRGHNLILTGPYYRGKTALATHLIEELITKKYNPVYFNCQNGFSEQAFLELYSKQILKTMSFKLKNIFEDSNKYLPNIRPKINMNPIHGVDIRIDYNITNKDIQQYLTEVIDVPYKIQQDTKEKMVIILDEYHAVNELKSVNLTEVILKNLKPGVFYIFISSHPKELDNLIPRKNYEKLLIDENMLLQKVPANVIYFSIDSILKDNNIKATTNIIDKLISMTEGEISFINRILRKLINKGKIFKRISLLDISNSIREIVNGYDDIFYNFFDSLSTHQKNLIIAIARQGGQQIFKGEFIYRNGLVSVPSVQTSIQALIKKNFVHKEDEEYKITHYFFKEWLKQNFL
ncbi:MAG: ATP-binding protein [Candidatus Margulisbacteria bacterium]|nr:ATP-binding protein [Candidatus Margulisiibacteriota bacterium]